MERKRHRGVDSVGEGDRKTEFGRGVGDRGNN